MRTGVGIVGCGVIADTYAAKLSSFPHVELVACADLVTERAEALAERFGIPKVLTPEKLFVDPDVDVVCNLTVPQAHEAVTRAAVDAGKHAYSEKPLALDRAAARSLVEAAGRAGVRLGCAPDTFMGAGLQTCRALVDDGAIGEPVAANGFFQYPGPDSWHVRPEIFFARGGGPVFDMAPYFITSVVTLLGPVRSVVASAKTTRTVRTALDGTDFPVEVPTHVSAVLDVSGTQVTFVLSFDVQTSDYRSIELYGTQATLAVPNPNRFDAPARMRKAGEERWTEVPPRGGRTDYKRGVGLADMAWAMRTGRPHRASGRMAAHVVDVMQSIVDAAETGRRVDVTSTCERPAPLPDGLPPDAFDD